MEIPEINMLSEFEAGMKCLQNPSFISRLSPFPSFWKWGALIFAIFATFGSIIRRIKLIFIRFHAVKLSSNQTEDVFEFSDDEDDDDDVSLASSDDEREAEEDRPTTSIGGQHRVDEDFCVRGSILSFKSQWQSGQLRQRRPRTSVGAWSEIACGKNVVKIWDSLGFSLDIDEDLFNYDPKSVVSTWDYDREENSSEFPDRVWGIPAASSTVLLTAERSGNGDNVILGAYDTRMRSHAPALYAEWRSPTENVGGVSTTGVGKVYVRDDVSGVVTVGDVRNVRRPLESVRESDGDTWWDADAVIVENEFESSK